MSDIAKTTPKTPQKAFIVRVKKGRKTAIDKGVIGIGWSRVEGVDRFHEMNRDQIKKQIQDAYHVVEQKLSPQALGNVAGSMERFCSMAVGDYVLMPVGKGFHVGIVESEVKKCNEDWVIGTHLQWQRSVSWQTKSKPIARNMAVNSLQKRLKIRQTCADVSKFLADINLALTQKTRMLFNERVNSLGKAAVIEAIRHLNDADFEKLIAKLCLSSGADYAKVLPKKDNRPGDADILSEYKVMVGKEQYSVCILYQAKRHENVSSDYGVKQLIDRIEALNQEAIGDDEDELFPETDVLAYKGCLVTTAPKVTDEAENLAEANSIDIITLDELADWILKVGISTLDI